MIYAGEVWRCTCEQTSYSQGLSAFWITVFHPSPQGTVDNASGLGLAGGSGHGVRKSCCISQGELNEERKACL